MIILNSYCINASRRFYFAVGVVIVGKCGKKKAAQITFKAASLPE